MPPNDICFRHCQSEHKRQIIPKTEIVNTFRKLTGIYDVLIRYKMKEGSKLKEKQLLVISNFLSVICGALLLSNILTVILTRAVNLTLMNAQPNGTENTAFYLLGNIFLAYYQNF